MQVFKNNSFVELHVPDFSKVMDYYGKLGFKVVRETNRVGKVGYLVIKLENNILCFWPGNDEIYKQSYFQRFPGNTQRGYGVEIVLMVDNVESYYQKVKSFAHVVSSLRLRPWGLKDFRIVDPFGYYLRVTSLHNVLNDLDSL